GQVGGLAGVLVVIVQQDRAARKRPARGVAVLAGTLAGAVDQMPALRPNGRLLILGVLDEDTVAVFVRLALQQRPQTLALDRFWAPPLRRRSGSWARGR